MDPDHAPDGFVGVNAVAVVADVFHPVGLLHGQKRHAGGNGTRTAVSPAVHIARDVPGNDPAFLVHAGFDGGNHGMALPGGNRVFLPGVDDLDRPAGLAGQ